MIQLHDRATLKASKKDARTGYLRADAVFSRVGIQTYMAWELGLQDRDPSDIVKINRSAEEVGKAASLESLKGIPTTDDHPNEDVTAGNWRKHATGWSGENVVFDGKVTNGSVVLTDAEAIAKWEAGKKELSVGYACEIVMEAGVNDAGEAFDGYQTNIFANHIAQVDAGRCGAECRIGDGKMCADCAGKQKTASCNCNGNDDMSNGTSPTLVSRTVDGFTIQTTEHGAQLIDKLVADLSTVKGQVTAAEQAATAAAEDHKKAIEAKDGEIAGLTAKIPDAAALDALATERANTIADCRAVLGDAYDFTGKTNAEMIATAVASVLGDEAVKDKSPEYLAGVFATVKKTSAQDGQSSFSHVVGDGFNGAAPRQQQQHNRPVQKTNDGAPTGRDAYLARLKTPAHLRKQA